jgi:hypothetical protein
MTVACQAHSLFCVCPYLSLHDKISFYEFGEAKFDAYVFRTVVSSWWIIPFINI